MKPKGTRRESVACAMRPKPMKPAVRVEFWIEERVESGLIDESWGPQKEKGDQTKFGH